MENFDIGIKYFFKLLLEWQEKSKKEGVAEQTINGDLTGFYRNHFYINPENKQVHKKLFHNEGDAPVVFSPLV